MDDKADWPCMFTDLTLTVKKISCSLSTGCALGKI